MAMNQKHILKICAAIIGVSSLVILAAVVYPIALYVGTARQKYPDLISPIVEDAYPEGIRLSSVEAAAITPDYTRASRWFVGDKSQKFVSANISYFTLTIPSLGIESATVAIGGEDLEESLIQYPGTALPGKIGNTVIFGHSILPQFFDPENYLAIFSTLPTLEPGDEIFIDYDGITYKYEIEDMFEVKPADIQVLEQREGDPFLSLITCTPPGHPLKPKRLVVRAKLIPITEPSKVVKQADANVSY